MRILLYSYNYHPEPIGIAPLMTELAEGLVQRGHQVRVVTGMPNYPQRQIYPEYRGKWFATEERNGVLIQRSYVWIRPQPGLLTRMLLDASFVLSSIGRALQGWRPDVVLLTSPPLPLCLPAMVLGWFYSCPVVLNLQDILPEAAIQLGLIKNSWAIRLFEVLEQVAYRSATTISVITEEFAKNLHQKGVSPSKICYIPNWVNTRFIRPLPQANAFRKAHGLEGKFVVLYAGNIGLTQGIETLLDAAALLQIIPNLVVVVVGDRQSQCWIRTYCQSRNINNIRLLDFQPREQLPGMLAAADVGLVLQRRQVISFNMPSKLQVLLASGRPIVASVPLEGIAARIVRQSGAGLLVPPESPELLAATLQDLYYHPEKATLLGRQGHQYAIDHYSLDQSLNDYEALFTQLVAENRAKVGLPAAAIAPSGSSR